MCPMFCTGCQLGSGTDKILFTNPNQILKEFEILEKTIAVTTDGGSEYSKALLKNDIGKSY